MATPTSVVLSLLLLFVVQTKIVKCRDLGVFHKGSVLPFVGMADSNEALYLNPVLFPLHMLELNISNLYTFSTVPFGFPQGHEGMGGP